MTSYGSKFLQINFISSRNVPVKVQKQCRDENTQKDYPRPTNIGKNTRLPYYVTIAGKKDQETTL